MEISVSVIPCSDDSEEKSTGYAAVPGAPATSAELVSAGRRAWPALAVPESDFIAFVGRYLHADGSEDAASLHIGDLYLACAYGLGVPGAAELVEEHYLSQVRRALARIGTAADMIADVCQEMCQRLVEISNPPPDRKTYAGRGSLTAWLCVSAVREANRRRERARRDVPLDALMTTLLPFGADPEMDYLERAHKEEMTLAFREAIASLSTRDRNLLRYSFLENLSIDQIGTIYRVHRSTAARWIERARRTLIEETRESLRRRMSVSEEGFQRMLALIASQIQVQLRQSG